MSRKLSWTVPEEAEDVIYELIQQEKALLRGRVEWHATGLGDAEELADSEVRLKALDMIEF